MTSIQQREQLQSQIWKIANEVRGAVDGWDFKQFVLGTLFYRFISENFTDYTEGGDDSIDYASLPDSIITPEIKEDAVKTAHTNFADFAFVLHALSYLSSRGRAAIVCFPGIFYRGGAEQKIRKYLVLSKHKPDTKIQFIDASGEGFFTKETNNNVLEDRHIDKIMDIFDKKEDVDYIAKSVDYKTIVENDHCRE